MGGITLPYMEGGMENLRPSPCSHEREGVNPAGRLPEAVEPWPVTTRELAVESDAERSRRKRIPDHIGI